MGVSVDAATPILRMFDVAPTKRFCRDCSAALRERGHPFLHPAVEPGPARGRELQLIDPASNRLRFFERSADGVLDGPAGEL